MSIIDLDNPNNISLITSLTQFHKRSSYETIFNISNTMMGTALLVIPTNFYSSGIISSILTALVMVLISYWTSYCVVIHSRDDEYDYPLAIRRLLGLKWEKTFNFVSFLLLFLVCIIHFILLANVLYYLIISISGSDDWPGFNEINFEKFSMQYVGIILFFVCGGLYSIKKIRYLLAINDKGIYMILLFSIYIIYIGIQSLASKDLSFVSSGKVGQNKKGLEIILFNSDLSQLIGVFSLAYMIHNTVCGIIKSNKNPQNNTRDLLLAYLLVFVKYVILGVFGSFAVAGLYNSHYNPDKLPTNIMVLLAGKNDFLNTFQKILGLICLFFVFLQLITVLPILNFFTRRQFYGLILGSDIEHLSNKKIHLFNLAFNIICLVFEIAVFEPVIVIAYTGAFGGFLLIYLIPIYCHLKCMYFKKPKVCDLNNKLDYDNNLEENLIEKEIIKNKEVKLNQVQEEESKEIEIKEKQQNKIESEGEVEFSSKHFNFSRKSINDKSSGEIKIFYHKNEVYEMCRTDYTHETTYSKFFIYPAYSLILLFGFSILVISIYNNIK